SSQALMLPNNFVTITKTANLVYNTAGQAMAWDTTKQELELRLTDLNRAAGGPVNVAVNRVAHVQREATVYQSDKEIAIKEKEITTSGVVTEAWTFFDYDGQGRADELLKIVKDPYTNTWTAEDTRVESFEHIQGQDLYGTTHT